MRIMILSSQLHSLYPIGFSAYAINQLGAVWSYRYKKFLKPLSDRRGYLRVNLRKDGGSVHFVLIHRLVAKMFIPATDSDLQVDHIDGDKTNNQKNNLRWVTNRQNAHFAMQNGLMPHAVFMSEQVVNTICKALQDGETVASIAKRTGYSYHALTAIRLRRNWTHISDNYVFSETNKHNHPTESKIAEMCDLILSGKSNREICDKLELRKETVMRTRHGRIYKQLMAAARLRQLKTYADPGSDPRS